MKHSAAERHHFWLLSYSRHFCPAAHLISTPIDFLDQLSAVIPHKKPSTVSLPAINLLISPSLQSPAGLSTTNHPRHLSHNVCAVLLWHEWNNNTHTLSHNGLWKEAIHYKICLSLRSPILHMGPTSQQANRLVAKHTHTHTHTEVHILVQHPLRGWQKQAMGTWLCIVPGKVRPC